MGRVQELFKGIRTTLKAIRVAIPKPRAIEVNTSSIQ